MLIAFNRAPHFAVHPQDALADRYLFLVGNLLEWYRPLLDARAGSKATPFWVALWRLMAVTAGKPFHWIRRDGRRSWAANYVSTHRTTICAYRHGIPTDSWRLADRTTMSFRLVGALRRSQVMIFHLDATAPRSR